LRSNNLDLNNQHQFGFAPDWTILQNVRDQTDMIRITRFLRDNRGATAIEYGLIAALIAVAAISAMRGTGNQLKTTFNTASSGMAA
jgi:pilus assembly protein Flp/PilA